MLFQTIASTGALQNLSSLSSSDAHLEIVQLHVRALGQGSLTGAMTVRGTAFPGTGKTVTVRKFSDLKGLSVALVGSARLMGQKLESQLGYGMLFLVADTDDEALAVLRAIEVQAVFTLGGCPVVPARRQSDCAGGFIARSRGGSTRRSWTGSPAEIADRVQRSVRIFRSSPILF